jgi:hypothetical protein
LVLAALSLLVKESCALIPVLLVAHDILIEGKTFRSIGLRRLLLSAFVGVLILPIQYLMRDPESMYEGTVGFTLFPFFQYIWTQGYYYLFHLWLFFDSSSQSILHEYPIFTPKIIFLGTLGLLYYGALIFWGWRFRRSRPEVSFFIAFYLVSLVTTNTVIQMINPFAEYRLYQGNASLCFFFAYGLDALSRVEAVRKFRSAVTVAFAVLFSIFNLGQQVLWANPERLFEFALESYPASYRLRSMLAQHYYDVKDFKSMEIQLLESERLALADPFHRTFRSTFMLARLYSAQSRHEEAAAKLESIRKLSSTAQILPSSFYELYLQVLKKRGSTAIFEEIRSEAVQKYPGTSFIQWDR